MSRVDFYVLSEDAPDAKLRVACRLIEKAFDSGVRVYAHAASLAEAQRLDELLWTFSDRTFIPHEVTENGTASHERVMVLIGTEGAPASHRQLLVNLTSSLPAEIENFERIAEIVDIEPENKRLSRERYKAYRERGCTLESHNL